MAPVRTLILALGLLAAAVDAHAQGCSKPIVIVTEDWPGRTSANKLQDGLDVDMARAILKEAGCTLISGPMLPIVRRITLLAEGRFDMMLAATDIPERHRFARFSIPYRQEIIGLFALEKKYEDYGDVISYDGIDQRKLRVLVPVIGWYGAEYERRRGELDAKGRLSHFSTFVQGLNMLAANRGELIMGDTVALTHQARLVGVPIRQLGFVVSRTPVSLMLSKMSTTERDIVQINAAIARLDKNGTLRAIAQRYGLN